MDNRRKSEIQRAARRFADFHGIEPHSVEAEPLAQTYFHVGDVLSISYEIVEKGKIVAYNHDFEQPAALAVSFDGKTALLSGGTWRFTARGFVG